MIIGHLRHKLTILAQQDTGPDEFGAPVLQWAPAGTVQAEIVHLSGQELQIAQQLNGQASHRVSLRYFRGLNLSQRLQFGDRIFQPIDIQDIDERHITHVVICTEPRQ